MLLWLSLLSRTPVVAIRGGAHLFKENKRQIELIQTQPVAWKQAQGDQFALAKT
jgi:hypothetical protein